VDASLDSQGRVQLRADSDSSITRGLAGLLVSMLHDLPAGDVLALDASMFLPQLGLGPALLAPSRSAGFANMLESIKRRVRLLTSDLPRFPSLLIQHSNVQPQGVFAEVQAQYLQPDPKQVTQLVQLLSSKQIGVVAHFYMDPQV
jgi:quinolinate synthase